VFCARKGEDASAGVAVGFAEVWTGAASAAGARLTAICGSFVGTSVERTRKKYSAPTHTAERTMTLAMINLRDEAGFSRDALA
jgi:hypothetical protein